MSIPGPLSITFNRSLSVFFKEPEPSFSISTVKSGKMPWSSHASKELSTASLRVVNTALVGEEKPTCCKFFAKYSAVLLLVTARFLDLLVLVSPTVLLVTPLSAFDWKFSDSHVAVSYSEEIKQVKATI